MSLPSSLQFFTKKISQYSRNTFRVAPTNSDVSANNQFIVFDLPNSSVIDLSSMSMNWRVTTTATTGFAVPPVHSSALIDSISLEVNGILVASVPSNYNQLYSMIADYTMGQDAWTRGQIINGTTQYGAVPTVNVTGQYQSVTSFLSFLGTCEPRCINTDLLGNCRLRVGLASPSVLVGTANVAGAAFSLSEIHLQLDALSLDPDYYAAQTAYLNSGAALEVPFTNVYSFSTGNLAASSGSVRFSLSSQSLDTLFGTFVENSNLNGLNTVTGTSNFFKRGCITAANIANAGAMTTSWSVNNIRYPSYPISAPYSMTQLLTTLGIQEDTLGGFNPKLTSLGAWLEHFWCTSYRFVHDGEDSSRTVGGVDSRGSVSNMELLFTGLESPSTKTALVFALTTAVLRIGQNRLIDVVY